MKKLLVLSVVLLAAALAWWGRPTARPAAATMARPAAASVARRAPRPPPLLARPGLLHEGDRISLLIDRLTSQYPFGRGRQQALRRVLDRLSAADLRAALGLTFGHDADNDLTHVLLERLATVDGGSALAFAREHHFGTTPPWWLSVIGGLRAPQSALADLTQLPAGDARTSFLSFAVGRWATVDRAAALDYAYNHAPPEAQNAAVGNVVMFVAQQDHPAGFDLALTHGPAIGDLNLVRQTATDWAAVDFAAARQRIAALPEGETAEPAREGLAAVAAARDGQAAMELIAEVNDTTARSELYRQAALQWLSRDPVAARAWLSDTTDLTSAQKDAILQADTFNHRLASSP